jgi:hypothetical protein
MLLSAFADAIHEYLISAVPAANQNLFAHSCLVVTREIIRDYESRFATSPTELATYQAFITAQSAGRLKVIGAGSGSLFDEYGLAADRGGKALATGGLQMLSPDETAALVARGVRHAPIANWTRAPLKIGFAPFETHTLAHNGTASPDLIERFFYNQKKITFYDKFVNQSSISAINFLIQKAATNASILIITSGQATLSPVQIRGMTRVVAGQTLSVEIANTQTIQKFHDRYIYVGDDYEFHVPRGLDIFGSGPNWRNSNGRIDIYDRHEGAPVEFAFDRAGGHQRGPVRLKSVLVA